MENIMNKTVNPEINIFLENKLMLVKTIFSLKRNTGGAPEWQVG